MPCNFLRSTRLYVKSYRFRLTGALSPPQVGNPRGAALLATRQLSGAARVLVHQTAVRLPKGHAVSPAESACRFESPGASESQRNGRRTACWWFRSPARHALHVCHGLGHRHMGPRAFGTAISGPPSLRYLGSGGTRASVRAGFVTGPVASCAKKS